MASKEAFAVACIELYGRLWAELERLSESTGPNPSDCAEQGALEAIEILRLEIQLLIDASERARWRMLLSAPQQLSLRSTLQGVLLALDEDPQEISDRAIVSAQNRLFDAVREHSTLDACAPALLPMRRLGS